MVVLAVGTVMRLWSSIPAFDNVVSAMLRNGYMPYDSPIVRIHEKARNSFG